MQRKYITRDTIESIGAFCEDIEMVFNAFKSGILPLQPIKGRDKPGMLA